MTIKWGDVAFSSPTKITEWEPPRKAALYVIMRPAEEQGSYYIIYVGESGNLSERGFYKNHHKYECWIEKAGSEDKLFIGIYTMPNSTEEERKKLESEILKKTKPPCND